MKWTTACPDWGDRLKRRESIIPPPIFPEQAEHALKVFKALRIVDAPGSPTFGEACDQWVPDGLDRSKVVTPEHRYRYDD